MSPAVRHTVFLAALVAGASAVVLPGCIELGGVGAPPECTSSADCNTAAGEVCGEGVCWGNPPAAEFAVVIGPPPERPDLVATELPSIAITPDGWIEGLTMSRSTTLHGRIRAACDGCRDASIAATVYVRRASRIAGGPEYLATTTSAPDSSTDSFSLSVPPSGPDDPPYRITIEPSDAVPAFPGGPTPAAVVPPLRATITAAQLADGLDIMLETDSVRLINGRVVDSVGQGVPGMRVSAKGLVDPSRPLERVSTIATTDDDGGFVLLLGTDALDVVDLYAVPPAATIAPTLVAHDRFVGQSGQVELRMPSFPGSAHVSVPVVQVETSGSETAVANAKVTLTTHLTDLIDPGVEAVFSVEGYTDAAGHFDADVIAGSESGARTYEARIVPPASAISASQVGVVEVGAQGGVLATVRLPSRSALTGTVVDFDHDPVVGLTVTASPSLFYLWSLDPAVQARLDEREEPSVLTQPDGKFTLWVDPTVADTPAVYDLECTPAEGAREPRWTKPEQDGTASRDVGEIRLPDAAHIRGSVRDPDGNIVQGALVRVYEIVGDLSSCVAENAPNECQPPAVLRATGRSDDDGLVRLVVPRP